MCGCGGHEGIPETSPMTDTTAAEPTAADIAPKDLAVHELNARAGSATHAEENVV